MFPNGLPTRKMSETSIDIAQPILAHVDSTTSQGIIRQRVLIAVTIWNAFVMDRVNGNAEFQTLMKKQLGEQWEINPVIKALVKRRKKDFADDMRLVSEHQVLFDANGYRLRAAASDPYTSKKR